VKYALLAPTFFFATLFVFWPLGELFVLSMMKTDFIITSFVGLQNYVSILTSAPFLRSVYNSLWYILFVVAMIVGGATAFSLAVMTLSKAWHDVSRVLIYLPMLSAGIVIAQVWRWIFHVDGPVNWLLGTQVNFFAQGFTSIPAISLIVASSGIGGTAIVIMASVLGISKELYDAATIDGASWFQIKLHIVLPLITPTVSVMALVAAIAAPQIFETIYALAPAEHSATVGWHIYREAFQMGRHGTAAAMSVLLLFSMLGLSWAKSCVKS